jgi:hypothetical protein
MLTRILTAVLFLAIMGLLVAYRFSLPPEISVFVEAVGGASVYVPGDELQRGQVIDSGDGYLRLSIGLGVSIWLSQQTTIELDRLYEDERTIRLTRGRIVVDHHDDLPLTIDTNFTSHKVLNDVVTFVNYDFLETIHVIPLSGSPQVYIESTGESLLTPVPLSIHETDPVSYSQLEVNLTAGDSADFYEWVGIISNQ